MSRSLLKYRGPKNGQAYVRTVRLNGGREVYLGKYNSPESHREYAAILDRLVNEAVKPKVLPPAPGTSISIVEAIAAFLADSEARYTNATGLRREFQNVVQSLRPLEELYGDLPINDFHPVDLMALQRDLVEEGYARRVINKRVTIIKRFFGWCSLNNKATGARPTLYAEMAPVKGLRRGEYGVLDHPKILPVPLAVVEQTLPFLSPMVATMVRVQLVCGMRPDEVCRMRPSEIRAAGGRFIYQPEDHKNAWRGATRLVSIPKFAIDMLRPYCSQHDFSAFCFRPAEAERRRHLARRPAGAAAAELPPDQQAVSTPAPSTNAGETREETPPDQSERFGPCYTAGAYWRAIQYAIAKAGRAGVTIEPWHPNRLRHTAATIVGKALGQEAAQKLLGHENMATTDVYREIDQAELLDVAQALDGQWSAIFESHPGIIGQEPAGE